MRTVERLLWGAIAALAVAALACAPRTSTNVEPRMLGHYQNASQLYGAAAGGDLARVHQTAATLLANETGEGMPERAMRHVDDLRAFARLASTAPDVGAASTAVARVAGTCGACHQTMKRGPRYRIVTGPPEGDTPVATRMLRHQWAADRLWDGLVGPSDESWRAGAAGLRDAPLFTDALTHDVAQYEAVTRLAWTVHDVGARANPTHGQAERANLYGELLGTCASCHALLGQLH